MAQPEKLRQKNERDGDKILNDEHLLKMQKEIMEEMEKESAIEQHIEESALQIAHELILKQRTKAVIDGKNFTMMYAPFQDEKGVKSLNIIAINDFHFSVGNGKYRPYTIKADLDDDYSEEENLSFAVESFIRHLSGLIKPEEIEG